MTIIFIAIATIALVVSAIMDMKEQAVYDILTATFTICCCGLAHLRGDSLFGIVALSLCLLCLTLPDISYLGGADCAILSGTLALFELWMMPWYMLCFSTLAIVIYGIETKITHSQWLVRGNRITLVPILAIAIPITYGMQLL